MGNRFKRNTSSSHARYIRFEVEDEAGKTVRGEEEGGRKRSDGAKVGLGSGI
jgi:uncharacterized protein Veg